jgi:histone demethylase
MHHTVDSLGERKERDDAAVMYLQMAVDAEPKNGQTLYLLGRCYSAMGRVHEAFTAYRKSVS